MPTEPLKSILDRDLSKVISKEDREKICRCLHEIINYSTKAFQRCWNEASQNGYRDYSVPILYLHIIEFTDGIETLLRESCVYSVIPLLRSSYEALLSIEYILKEKDEYEKRSLSWFYHHLDGVIKKRLKFDQKSQEWTKFQEIIDQDPTFKQVNLTELYRMAPKTIDGLKTILKENTFEIIVNEKNRIAKELKNKKKSKRKRPEWHSFFNGPDNMRELAKRLNSEAQYLFLYQDFSEVIHANVGLRFLRLLAEENPFSSVIRNPKDLRQFGGFSASFLLGATRMILEKFRPGENYQKWYLENIREDFFGNIR